jgi:ATP-dependent Zn protease
MSARNTVVRLFFFSSQQKKVTFKDVAGVEEAKEEVSKF